jgi:aminopeptidase N
VLQTLHAWANSALTFYAAPEWRATGGRLLAEGALRELRSAGPGSQHQLTWARFFAAVASGEDELRLLRELLEGTEKVDGLDVDQELRWAFLEPLAAHGVVDEAVLAAELARDDTASGKRHQVRCLAARPSAAVKAQAWAAVVESDSLSNALVEATIGGFAQASHRELAAPYASKYFDVIERVWEERSIQIGMDVVRGLFPSLQDSAGTLAAADAWLASHGQAAPALRRLVSEARDDLGRALRGQACDGAAPRP